jgi:hypothetical protein
VVASLLHEVHDAEPFVEVYEPEEHNVQPPAPGLPDEPVKQKQSLSAEVAACDHAFAPHDICDAVGPTVQ